MKFTYDNFDLFQGVPDHPLELTKLFPDHQVVLAYNTDHANEVLPRAYDSFLKALSKYARPDYDDSTPQMEVIDGRTLPELNQDQNLWREYSFVVVADTIMPWLYDIVAEYCDSISLLLESDSYIALAPEHIKMWLSADQESTRSEVRLVDFIDDYACYYQPASIVIEYLQKVRGVNHDALPPINEETDNDPVLIIGRVRDLTNDGLLIGPNLLVNKYLIKAGLKSSRQQLEKAVADGFLTIYSSVHVVDMLSRKAVI